MKDRRIVELEAEHEACIKERKEVKKEMRMARDEVGAPKDEAEEAKLELKKKIKSSRSNSQKSRREPGKNSRLPIIVTRSRASTPRGPTSIPSRRPEHSSVPNCPTSGLRI